VTARLWVDVEDLFEYARGNRRPSGIQRLAFEIYRAMQAQYGNSGLVRFVRHDVRHDSFRTVSWHDVAQLFDRLVELAPDPPIRLEGGITPHPPARRLIRKLVHRLPPSLRAATIGVVMAQMDAFRAWVALGSAIRHGARRGLTSWATRIGSSRVDYKAEHSTAPEAGDEAFATSAAEGDILLVLGSPWSHPDYPKLVRALRQRGLRFALLVYDLIPIRRPEWCDRGLVRLFRAWFQNMLPLCDFMFSISRATAADVEAYARENGIALPGPVIPIPIGSGFGTRPQRRAKSHERALPSAGSYVLFVSTIEARKNHTLLFRVWRRLLEDMPAEQVPMLVFAGRIGWLVDDLMRQIANSNYLDGKLVVIEDPTDSELVTLYRGCLFTVFPSFYEGWGLPVTESLSFGKPCVISNRTSLPEAGGKLVRAFDPDNLNDAYQVVRQVIEDPAGLTRWEEDVRREFRPVPWSTTVGALLAGLGSPVKGSSDAMLLTQSKRSAERLFAESA
jgi:glycosyltransferase involved in cell wall biosynthesis